MKEVMAIIRMNKIGDTKNALSEAGFPAITCRKVYGRGKKKVDFELISDLIDGQPIAEVAKWKSIVLNAKESMQDGIIVNVRLKDGRESYMVLPLVDYQQGDSMANVDFTPTGQTDFIRN